MMEVSTTYNNVVKSLSPQFMYFSFEEQDYTEYQIDTSMEELFVNDDEEESDAVTQGIGSKENTIEYTEEMAELGISAANEQKQTMVAAFDVNNYKDQPDKLQFLFKLDAPRAALERQRFVTQYASISLDGTTFQTIECTTKIGEALMTTVNLYEGTTSMDTTTQTGNTYKNQNSGDKVENSGLLRREDASFYALQESELDVNNNMLSNCLAEIEVEKEDLSRVGEYTMKLGARIYKDSEDTDPVDFGESTTTLSIPEPSYDDFRFDPYAEKEWATYEAYWEDLTWDYQSLEAPANWEGNNAGES